ncbi:MAG: hypothetical protein V1933_01695 [Candidatus Omnitrophota bacterium]
MKKIYLLYAIILVFVIFLSLPFVFLVNRKLGYYAYKQVFYRTLINHIVGSENDPEKAAIILMEYFYDNLFSPDKARIVDKDAYVNLIRGIAWCDQRAWTMGKFLGRLGIDNRMIMIKNPAGISNHTALEVFIDEKWRYFDPQYGIFIRGENGELLSYADICAKSYLFCSTPAMLAVKKVDVARYDNLKEFITANIFYANPLKPDVWNNPLKGDDFKRRAITGTLDFYCFIFRDFFSYLYQDLYASFYLNAKNGENLYLRARNYDLFGRTRLAEDYYKRSITDSRKGENAIFFLAVMYNKINEFQHSADTLRLLLARYPGTKWEPFVYYYLGRDCEELRDYAPAKDYYKRAMSISDDLHPAGRLYSLLNRQ